MERNRRTLQEALFKGTVKFAGHIEVRGGHFHDMWEAKVNGKLDEGAWLKMVREPKNYHDHNAIAVYSGTQKIGYVAKEKAEELAPIMDFGTKMALRVLSHIPQPLRLVARLYIKK